VAETKTLNCLVLYGYSNLQILCYILLCNMRRTCAIVTMYYGDTLVISYKSLCSP